MYVKSNANCSPGVRIRYNEEYITTFGNIDNIYFTHYQENNYTWVQKTNW